MELEFFDIKTNSAVTNDDGYLVMDNKVFRDTFDDFESQEFTCSLHTFIEHRPDIGFRIANEKITIQIHPLRDDKTSLPYKLNDPMTRQHDSKLVYVKD